MEYGESYEEAAKKEASEELGIDEKSLEGITQVDKYPYGDDNIEPRMLALFTIKLDWPTDKFSFPADEVEAIRWISKQGLAKDVVANPNKYLPQAETWAKFLAKGAS